MTGVNWGKLATALVAMICVSVLMALGKLDAGSGVPVITLVIGYMLGNGVAAHTGDPVQPILFKRPATVPAPVGRWTDPSGVVWVRDVADGPWRRDEGRMVCGQLYACTFAVVVFAVVLGIVLGW